jgi:hypothetical protein
VVIASVAVRDGAAGGRDRVRLFQHEVRGSGVEPERAACRDDDVLQRQHASHAAAAGVSVMGITVPAMSLVTAASRATVPPVLTMLR